MKNSLPEKVVVRFIVYEPNGSLHIVEKDVSIEAKRFDVCQFFDRCPYADLDGVICTEESDLIRGSVCPSYVLLSGEQKYYSTRYTD